MLHFLSPAFFEPELILTRQQKLRETCTEDILRHLDLERLKDYVPHPGLFPRFRQPIFLHLFSGRRRPQDLQQQLEMLDWTPSLCPLVISIDVMVSEQCNLMSDQQRAFWLEKALSGQVDGGLGGPPCETWSSARSHILNGENDPRPLRTDSSLWGMQSLSMREEKQVDVGSRLLTFCLTFLLIMWLKGRWFVLEHPREPLALGAPAIWKLPLVQLLMALPGIERHLVWQGLFSGLSPKPTHLLFAHPSTDIAALDKMFRSSRMPPALRMGRDSESKFFRTAILKEYPGPFNRFLAEAFFRWHCSSPQPVESKDFPDTDLQFLRSLVVSVEQSAAIFGPDFAG